MSQSNEQKSSTEIYSSTENFSLSILVSDWLIYPVAEI